MAGSTQLCVREERQSQEEHHDGTIVLGKGSDLYYTGFFVRLREQRAAVWNEVLVQCFCEAFRKTPDHKRSICARIWYFCSSELVLATLHLLTIILGVLKATIHKKEVDERLHIAESVVETLVAIAQLVIRLVNSHQKFNEIKENQEKVEIDEGNARGRGMRRWLVAFQVLGSLLVIFCAACAVTFYFIEHMEWTILSNNFALIVGTVTSNLLLDRINHMIYVIREDQHKAVIYESLMLLAQNAWTADPKERQKLQQRIDKFCTALRETALFDKPPYMDCNDQYKPHWDMLTSMQIQTNV